uniref:Uncharacterized protein n=1 Tax=mine drainage metagenome TaxID=410659 RepID=E6QR60_9ZZZZ
MSASSREFEAMKALFLSGGILVISLYSVFLSL